MFIFDFVKKSLKNTRVLTKQETKEITALNDKIHSLEKEYEEKMQKATKVSSMSKEFDEIINDCNHITTKIKDTKQKISFIKKVGKRNGLSLEKDYELFGIKASVVDVSHLGFY